MFFRNLTLYRFPVANAVKLARLEALMADFALRALGPLELSTRGWVSPFGAGESALMHVVAGYQLIALGGYDKLLPGSVVNDALRARMAVLEKERGKPVGGRERRKLKDEVITDLLPRALARPMRLMAYIDAANGWIVVDTTSRSAAEALLSKLRETLGSFPVLQAEAEESPRAVMTEWLIDHAAAQGFAFGDECVLKDPADQGAIVRCRRQDLQSDEVREHLKSGKQVTELALVFEERMRFTLDENLTVRKFKLLDIATESLGCGDRASANAELDARFALMVHELAGLLARVEGVFGVSRPAGG